MQFSPFVIAKSETFAERLHLLKISDINEAKAIMYLLESGLLLIYIPIKE
jgi:hypothetical protein